ncbi:MarR family winged helix-turn-helix transcriptional regulator [Subtercola vilae]|uniref:MarR family winged helix-turn-helix transcriptional regulator n=1 Tax=Subtercola vilae TaxID=2056433 RepID=UPI00137570D4|nr:MarR family transcriptional regulator [Subtercola vilae]
MEPLTHQTDREAEAELPGADSPDLGHPGRPRHADAVDAIRSEWSDVRPDLDTDPIGTFGRVLRIARHLALLSDDLLAGIGISRGEFDVLSAVRRASGAPTPSDLARTLLASNASITKRLVQLERAGLAERRRDSRDGRVSTVWLTDAGLSLIDDAMPPQLEFDRRLGSVLSPAQNAELEASLRILLLECERLRGERENSTDQAVQLPATT